MLNCRFEVFAILASKTLTPLIIWTKKSQNIVKNGLAGSQNSRSIIFKWFILSDQHSSLHSHKTRKAGFLTAPRKSNPSSEPNRVVVGRLLQLPWGTVMEQLGNTLTNTNTLVKLGGPIPRSADKCDYRNIHNEPTTGDLWGKKLFKYKSYLKND